MQVPIISFKDFSFQYRAQKRPTLRHINLDIYPGERVLIAGPSGSGKSTLGSCLNGLIPASYPGTVTGALTVDGVDAPKAGVFELSRHVGTVLQDPDGQFIGLTVGEDIAFALENDCAPQAGMRQAVDRVAALVGVENHLGSTRPPASRPSSSSMRSSRAAAPRWSSSSTGWRMCFGGAWTASCS